MGGEKKKKKKGIRKSGCWTKEKGESDHCVPSDYYCHSNNEKLDEGSITTVMEFESDWTKH